MYGFISIEQNVYNSRLVLQEIKETYSTFLYVIHAHIPASELRFKILKMIYDRQKSTQFKPIINHFSIWYNNINLQNNEIFFLIH